jgi:hypothetical protein
VRGNFLNFVREYDQEERRLAFGGAERFRGVVPSLEPPNAAQRWAVERPAIQQASD